MRPTVIIAVGFCFMLPLPCYPSGEDDGYTPQGIESMTTTCDGKTDTVTEGDNYRTLVIDLPANTEDNGDIPGGLQVSCTAEDKEGGYKSGSRGDVLWTVQKGHVDIASQDGGESFSYTINRLGRYTFRARSGKSLSEHVIVGPRIVPDDNMAGVLGDMVPSTKEAEENHERHFVTPKKNATLDAEYVVFKVVGMAKSVQFDKFCEWGPEGETVPDEPTKRRVKRDAVGKTTLTVKSKVTNAAADKLNVWVVWATIAPRTTSVTYSSTDFPPYRAPEVKPLYLVATIKPDEIVAENDDRPKLDEVTQTMPPGTSPISEGDSLKRWDISRKTKSTYLNPSPTTLVRSDFDASFWENTKLNALTASFPSSSIVVTHYPSADLDGNDDHSTKDEDNDPYLDSQAVGVDPPDVFTPTKGQLASWDAPQSPFIRITAGQSGEEFECLREFLEFVRLQIGDKWYRVSENYYWQYNARFIRGNSEMTDNGSAITP